MARHPYQASAEQSPLAAGRRLLEVYAIGSAAAHRHHAEGVRHTLALLRSTLSPGPAPELALSLSAIYDDVEAALQADQFDEVSRLFDELKGLWEARIRLENTRK